MRQGSRRTAGGASLLLDLANSAPLPDFGDLDGVTPFAAVRAGWNDAGIGFRVEVARKKMPIAESSEEPVESDGLQVWIDTRNTQSIHRASRFCHRFVFLPGTGGKSGSPPSAVQLPIALAKEDAPLNRAGLLRVASQERPGGYVLDAWIPADAARRL